VTQAPTTLGAKWREFQQASATPELVLREDGVWLRIQPPWPPLPLGVAGVFAFFATTALVVLGIDTAKGALMVGLIALVSLGALLVALAMPGCEAHVTRTDVRVTPLGRLPFGRTSWVEPLSAYRGLHASMVRWTGPTPQYDDTRINPGRYEPGHAPVWSRDPSMASRHREGRLVLEHATDPARSLLLARRDGRAIETAFAQDVAARIGLPLRWTH